MKNIAFILFLTSFFFFFSCKNTNSSESTQTDSTSNPKESTTKEENEKIDEPKSTKLYAWVDKLNLRAEPSTKSEIVVQIKEGTQLTFLNEKTEYTERINLRGQLQNEPWLKVKTEDGKKAWVYGGAVKFYKPVVDVNPGPYDKCFRLNKDGRETAAETCFNETRLKQLRIDSKYVSESKGVTLKLLGGDYVEIKDQLHPDSSQINHMYVDYLPKVGFFVIKNYYFEASDYSLVNDKSGKITKVKGFPKASPNGKYLLTFGPDLASVSDFSGIQIFGFPDGKFAKMYDNEWYGYDAHTPIWIDNESFDVTLIPSIFEDDPKPKIAKLRFNDGEWGELKED